jgi:tetratricopeptide (TPR) repeat protein
VRPIHLVTAISLFLALPGCGPRRPVVAPPPPAPAPPPPPAPTAEELASVNAAQAESYWNQGIQAGRAGRWYDAERLYRQAATAQPSLPRYHMALAAALLQLGRDSDAATAMLAGIRAEEALPQPNHRVLSVDYERLIQLLERTGRLDEARTARERQRFHRMMRDAAPPR